MIYKAKVITKFSNIPNEMSQDKNLTWQAKGLLLYILSLPEGWVIRRDELTNHSKNQYHSTNTAFKELLKVGYILQLERVRTEDNTLGDSQYLVYALSINSENFEKMYGEVDKLTCNSLKLNLPLISKDKETKDLEISSYINKTNNKEKNIESISLSPSLKEEDIDKTSIEEKMAYQWTLHLKERFAKRPFNKKDLKVDLLTIKKMQVAIERNISIEQLKEATENASMNDYHINNKFDKIKQPQWMLQGSRGKDYKPINLLNVEFWLEKSKPKEVDDLKEIFKDLWKDIFGYYENNIDFEWKQLTEEEKFEASEKIQSYKESVLPDETKYLKRPKGYLSSKVFKSNFTKAEISLTSVNKEKQTFSSTIKKYIKDKKNLQILQRIGQTYSLQEKDLSIENISFLENTLFMRMKEVMKKVKAEENNKNETEFRLGKVEERLNISPIVTKENKERAIEIIFQYIKETSESGFDTGRYGNQISSEWLVKVTKPH